MYIKPNKPQKVPRFSYIVLAAAGALLILILILTAPSFLVRSDPPSGTDSMPPAATSADPPETADSGVPATTPQETEPLPFDTGIDTTADTTAAPTPDTTPAVSDTEPPVSVPNAAVLGKTEDAGQEYLDKIVFIGDSTTYSFLYYGVLSGGKETTQVWTPASRTLTLDHATTTTILYPETEEEITIKEAISRKKPEIVVITLGVNGISYMQEEYFISVYKKLVAQIKDASPETNIVLQSIFPVAENWEKTKSINNDKINAANGWVKTVAEETGVHYLDTVSVLAVADNGYLPMDWQNGDGLHLNPTSLNIVLDYIRTHALPGYADPITE